jgi:hypothetical protein
MSDKEESPLKKIKDKYKEYQARYNLPSFEQLNEDFYLEKVAETETDLLVREIRKFMADRLFNYLRFVESILNPVNSPMFVFSVTKTLTQKDKETLSEIYKKLAEREIEVVELDIEFNEQKEAQFIRSSFELWQGIKRDMKGVVETIKKNWNNKTENSGKGYFG